MSTDTITPPTEIDSLHIRVDSAIRQHPHLRGSGIEPKAEGDSIVLRGTVGSYFIKQMAQEAIRGLAGAEKVDNQIKVNW